MALSRDDLDIINNNINGEFNDIARKSISSLEINTSYLIKKLSLVNTRYGKCILAVLFDQKNNLDFKCFLPKRVTEHMPEDILDKMNSSWEEYTLTYIGQSEPAFKDAKCKALIKFGIV